MVEGYVSTLPSLKRMCFILNLNIPSNEKIKNMFVPYDFIFHNKTFISYNQLRNLKHLKYKNLLIVTSYIQLYLFIVEDFRWINSAVFKTAANIMKFPLNALKAGPEIPP